MNSSELVEVNFPRILYTKERAIDFMNSNNLPYLIGPKKTAELTWKFICVRAPIRYFHSDRYRNTWKKNIKFTVGTRLVRK